MARCAPTGGACSSGWSAAARRRCASARNSWCGRSRKTALPTTSTPTPRAPIAPGSSTCCPTCCRPRNGSPSRPGSPSARGCSMPCWPTSMASSNCSPKGCCPANWSTAIPTSSGPARACGRPAASTCTATRWTWPATSMAAGMCWPTAPRRLRAPAMPWKTGRSFPAPCRSSIATCGCSTWPATSAPCRKP
ncbi:hypothetical protein D3C78_1436990 [compost metagenome]